MCHSRMLLAGIQLSHSLWMPNKSSIDSLRDLCYATAFGHDILRAVRATTAV
jgi:hypothetical protein